MQATRIGDGTSGVCDVGLPCCPHGRAGTNSTGSSNVFINGLPAHRVGDFGACNCPHGGTFQSTSGSSTVFINGRPATRTGDATACVVCGMPGSHVSGSPNVFIGG
ncbi:MAG: PAAR domain-containing protein [Selenomonadaceae bacterium]|nr:PAAR domain-containing protein [Selenomonadaceae bacterium]MBR1805804.1 PAAR domain-containing protein [Selenomonadaceae bacterium]